MKLPELLKKAVENRDWKSVCAVYTAITGEPLSPPPEPEKEPVSLLTMDIPAGLLAALGLDDSQEASAPPSNSHYEDDVEQETETETPKKKDHNTIDDFRVERKQTQKKSEDGKIEARKESMDIPLIRKNRYSDNLEVAADLLKTNAQFEKMYGKSPGRAKILIEDRPQTGKEIDVVCSLCKTAATIPVSLSHGWNSNPDDNTYRCTSCCTPAGRSKVLRRNREEGGIRKVS